jgi:hypothetical protein
MKKLDEIEHREANIAAATTAQLASIVHFIGMRSINPAAKTEFKHPNIFLPFPDAISSSGVSAEESKLQITEKTKHVLNRLVQERRIPVHVYMRMSRPPSPSGPPR